MHLGGIDSTPFFTMKVPFCFFYLCILVVAIASCTPAARDGEVDQVTLKEEKTRNLFIIGGGSKPAGMLQFLLDSCVMNDGPVVILPWASSEPDTSAYYIAQDFTNVTDREIAAFTVIPDSLSTKQLEQLKNAALIYITGGDQSRFMEAISGTEVLNCIVQSQANGSCVAGTSAGAAMMSQWMITGDENFEPEYHSTYNKLWVGNGIYVPGLGLLDDAIIDQHFVARSRYNRLLSAICEHPSLLGIGIDESTAAWINGSRLTVVGDSQVLLFYPPQSVNVSERNISANGIQIDILVAGDKIKLP